MADFMDMVAEDNAKAYEIAERQNGMEKNTENSISIHAKNLNDSPVRIGIIKTEKGWKPLYAEVKNGIR